ncbi:MAG: hypothetical protein FWD81_02845 [Methanomassiliicoccaceae archaeon]|nr:hypothetical protein [Methanomassiliicoccaceae archaeon]
MYEVYTKYDDGFESRKSYENITEAKSYFHNVDVRDIEICTLCEIGNEGESTEVARKEPRKKQAAAETE